MTETEWPACTSADAMLEWLVRKISVRKVRLFGCACCRQAVTQRCINGLTSKILKASERYADQHIKDGTALKWHYRAARSRDSQKLSAEWAPGFRAPQKRMDSRDCP